MLDIDKKLMEVMRTGIGNRVATIGRFTITKDEGLKATSPEFHKVEIFAKVEWGTRLICADHHHGIGLAKDVMIKAIKHDMYKDVINALIDVEISLLGLPCDAEKEISMIKELINDLS